MPLLESSNVPFSFDLSHELQEVLAKIRKKNPGLARAVDKKIVQITQLNDETTINHFKNLRHDASDYKRMHVGSFVLFFHVFEKERFILFTKFVHHDDAYKR